MSEEESAALITHTMAFGAVRKALVAAVSPSARVFPAVIGHGVNVANTFSVKAGSTTDVAGLKVGSFWPGNPARGLPRHHSTILLIDEETGRIGALIEAARVNAYRTAAADAVAVDLLSRKESTVLSIFGAGNQGLYEVLALREVRDIQRVNVVSRNAESGETFVRALRERGMNVTLMAAEEACRSADIIVTATPSRAPLFDASWVREGTHISAMGADAVGKWELPTELLLRASLFCDLPEQSLRIGEFQRCQQYVQAGECKLAAIGDVIEGRSPGRLRQDQITVFDSSGISLQDLYIGAALLDAS